MLYNTAQFNEHQTFKIQGDLRIDIRLTVVFDQD